MKITKELSDTRFEIELEPHDYEKTEGGIHMVVAHDYVQFWSREWVQTESECPPLKSEYQICANTLPIYQTVQIPIRDMVEVILPKLSEHKYCQKSHLTGKDGEPKYETTQVVTYYEDGVKMIAIPEEGEFYHIPYSLYKKLKENHD